MGKKEFYTKEEREKNFQKANDPVNQMRGITESTGILILDGIYVLIKELREFGGITEHKS